MFAKFLGKSMHQRLHFNKVAFLGCKKETLAQVFSHKFSKISKITFLTEHLRTTASAFTFSEAATKDVLWKKVFLKIVQNSQENNFGLQNFQEHLFYRTPLNDFTSEQLVSCIITKIWALPIVFRIVFRMEIWKGRQEVL